MNKNKKIAVITGAIIILCLLLFFLFKLITPAFESNVIHYDSPELSRFDISSKTHDISSWVNYLIDRFSYLYSGYGINQPSQAFVNNFFIDIKKDNDGWYISAMILSVHFTHNNQLYVQSFNVWPDTASSYITKSSMPGEEHFTDTDTFFSRLDSLDFGYFTGLLPECEYYHLEYLSDTTTFHKNAPELGRYLVNKDNIESGEMPNDKEIGSQMQVFNLFSMVEINDGQYQNNGGLDIYLNN